MKTSLKSIFTVISLSVVSASAFHFWSENQKLKNEIQKQNTTVSMAKIFVEKAERDINAKDENARKLTEKLNRLQIQAIAANLEDEPPADENLTTQNVAPGGP